MAIYTANLTGDSIKRTATGIAGEVERYMLRWKLFAEKLGTLTAGELSALGLNEDYQTYLGSLRVSLLNIDLKYRNQNPLDSSDPSYFVKLFTDLAIF